MNNCSGHCILCSLVSSHVVELLNFKLLKPIFKEVTRLFLKEEELETCNVTQLPRIIWITQVFTAFRYILM